MKNQTKMIRSLLVFSIFFVLIGPSAVSAGSASSDAPSVCQDKNGGLKTGAIDVLVLLDNSGSLIEDKTDPDGQRFKALDEFVENFSRLSTSKKNFGLIKFALSAEMVVPLQPLNASNSEDIRQQIRSGVTDPSGATDYIAAFKIAMEILKGQPENNCKIIIWFTDGGYQIRKIELDKDLARLDEAFCSETGFVSDIQSLDINTFVVFLGDGLSKDGNTQSRNNASIDAMQVITGDKTPSIKSGGTRAVISPTCKARFDLGARHLGEVVSASEAADLLGYLTDIVNIADGGTTATASECPVLLSSVETVPMPSGWYVDWVSITSWDGDLPSGDSSDSLGLKIRINGKDQPFAQFFEPIVGKDSSNVLRFKVLEGKQNDLTPGWVLHADGIGRVCIRIKPPEIKFRLQGDQKIALSPSGLPAEFFNGGQLTCVLNNQQVECSSTAGDGLVGKIKVQNGSVFNQDEMLSVSFVIDDIPSLIDDRCVIELTGKHEASSGLLSTTQCNAYPAPNSEFEVVATDLLSQLNECGVGSWSITIDDKQTAKMQAGDKSVRIGISTTSAPKNINKACKVLSASLSFRSSSAGQASVSTIQSTIDFHLIKKANPLLAAVIAAIATLIVSILSLLLLRMVNMLTSKTIAAEELFGYEVSVDLVPGQFKRGELNVAGGNARLFVADFDILQQISGNAQRTALNFGSISLLRQLPRFAKPFEEARLVLQSKVLAVFWKSNSASDGLNMTFAKALILSTTEKRVPSAERPAKVTVSALVPKRGFGAGVDGVQQLVRERGDELAAELYDLLVSLGGEEAIKEPQLTAIPGNPTAAQDKAPGVSSGTTLPPSPASTPQSRPTDITAGERGSPSVKPPQRPGPPEPPRRNS